MVVSPGDPPSIEDARMKRADEAVAAAGTAYNALHQVLNQSAWQFLLCGDKEKVGIC